MKIHRVDHIGIIVNDLPAATAFFQDFGLQVQGEGGGLEGKWLDHVIGVKDAQTEFIWLRAADGGVALELIKYHSPPAEQEISLPQSNTPGIRHIAFTVQDIEALVAKLKARGVEFFSEIQTYEDIYKLCYCRGPEGMILELAEEIHPEKGNP